MGIQSLAVVYMQRHLEELLPSNTLVNNFTPGSVPMRGTVVDEWGLMAHENLSRYLDDILLDAALKVDEQFKQWVWRVQMRTDTTLPDQILVTWGWGVLKNE